MHPEQIETEHSDPGSAEFLRNTAFEAGEQIDNEFARTENDWMACFMTPLTVLRGSLDAFARLKKELGHERYERISDEVDSVIREAKSLQETYSQRYPLPPEDIREKLLTRLRNIGDMLE